MILPLRNVCCATMALRLMKSEDAAQLTRDDFLGGRLAIWQPKKGYRAGLDAVMLAAAVEAQAGESVLELGLGVGVASLCLGRRVSGVHLTGLEVQSDYADLARRNAAENDIPLEVVEGDLSQMPATLKARRFDHVFANPPYFDRAASSPAPDAGRERAMGEETPLAMWVTEGAKRLAPKGTLTMICRTARLPELLAAMTGRVGSIEVLPLVSDRGQPAKTMLVRGKQAGRAEFRLHDPWLVHESCAQPSGAKNLTPATDYVARHAGPLPFVALTVR